MTDIDSAVFSIVSQGKILATDFEDFLLPSAVLDEASLDWHSHSSNRTAPCEWSLSEPHVVALTQQLPPTTCSDALDVTEIFKFNGSEDSWSGSEQDQPPSPFEDDLKSSNSTSSSVSSKTDASNESKPRWGKMRRRRNKKPGFWTREEHERFLAGLA
eukprot:1628585-Rhodomonas_salina.2